MMGLRDFLLGGRADFYPFEMRIIDAVKSRLDDEAASRLQGQIAVINKIQRLSDGKEVNLYQMRGGKALFDDNRRFPDAADEALLASVNLTGPDERANLKAEVWLAKGRLFSLVFNKPPKQFFAGMNLAAAQPHISDVKIWFDPMHPHAPSADKLADVSALRGWLREWHAKGLATNLHAPLPPAECSAHLARIDAQLPIDYLELLAQSDGARLARCVIFGAAEARKVVWPEANYYVIAEIEGMGALAVKEGDRNAEIYLLRYEENDVRPVGTSLQKALSDLLSQ